MAPCAGYKQVLTCSDSSYIHHREREDGKRAKGVGEVTLHGTWLRNQCANCMTEKCLLTEANACAVALASCVACCLACCSARLLTSGDRSNCKIKLICLSCCSSCNPRQERQTISCTFASVCEHHHGQKQGQRWHCCFPLQTAMVSFTKIYLDKLQRFKV